MFAQVHSFRMEGQLTPQLLQQQWMAEARAAHCQASHTQVEHDVACGEAWAAAQTEDGDMCVVDPGDPTTWPDNGLDHLTPRALRDWDVVGD